MSEVTYLGRPLAELSEAELARARETVANALHQVTLGFQRDQLAIELELRRRRTP